MRSRTYEKVAWIIFVAVAFISVSLVIMILELDWYYMVSLIFIAILVSGLYSAVLTKGIDHFIERDKDIKRYRRNLKLEKEAFNKYFNELDTSIDYMVRSAMAKQKVLEDEKQKKINDISIDINTTKQHMENFTDNLKHYNEILTKYKGEEIK